MSDNIVISNTTLFKSTATSTTVSSNVIVPTQHMAQNYLLIWLDFNVGQFTQDYQNTLTQLRNVVNDVKIFTELNQCVDFLTDIDDIKVFMIVAGTIGQQIISLIHNIPNLDAIYIFHGNKSTHEQSFEEWTKVKGVHTEIATICESLQHDVKQCNEDAISMSFIAADEDTSHQDLNELEPSFMYSQIFKEILLEMKHDEQSIKDFVAYCRNGNYGSPDNITRFENEYHAKVAIWWYTSPTFIYFMLNYALRLLEADTIIKMGFFICDLHHQIERLHQNQMLSGCYGKPFVVYRGQGISTKDFDKLLKTENGLISFNNFLSTSTNRGISFFFAEMALTKTDTIGIFFKMSIDPSVTSAPFASIQEVSHLKTEEEILFSMHTVFRVGEITRIDNNRQLYQVDLTLTSDDDEQLRILTNRIREEAGNGTGWERLSNLLIKIGRFNKAEEFYNVLLKQISSDRNKATCYNNLGCMKDHQGDYQTAVWYYEKALEMRQKFLPQGHPDFGYSYNNIGIAYGKMREWSKALSYCEKGLEIYQKILPSNHPDLAASYNNIGQIYCHMGDYSKAALFHEKALKIYEKILPSNHPDLAMSYNNIGSIYQNMREFSKALSCFEKTRKIFEKSLLSNHPDLATSYNNIGGVYYNMKEYSKALFFCEKSLEIFEKVLPPNHPNLGSSYINISYMYKNMREHSKALFFCEKSIEIFEKILPLNDLNLAALYNHIASMYHDMGDCLKALSFCKKALETQKEALPSNHPSLATSYQCIGVMYHNMGENSKALLFYEKALEICQKSLPLNYPLLATSYNNIGAVFMNMGENSKALSFCEKALEIRQRTLSPNHPDLISSYQCIGLMYQNMEKYSEALSFYEKALEIQENAPSSNHSSLANSYNNIGGVYRSMKQNLQALSFYEKALQICEKNLPPNHPSLAACYNNIACTYCTMNNYREALAYLERARDIWKNSLPENHPHIKTMKGLDHYLESVERQATMTRVSTLLFGFYRI